MHKKDQGSLGELLVITEVVAHGLSAFTDVGDNSRVDLIVMDDSSKLFKIQTKMYARLPNGTTELYFTKSGPGGYRYTYQLEDVDYFAVVDLETRKIAWVKYADFFGMKRLALSHVGSNRLFSDFESFPFLCK